MFGVQRLAFHFQGLAMEGEEERDGLATTEADIPLGSGRATF